MSHSPPEPPDSPYAPPSSQLDARFGPPTEERLATTAQRFLTYWIDYAAIVLLYVFLLLVTRRESEGEALEDLLLSTATYLIYYLAFESSFGATLGKFATGVRVVAEDGGPPRLAQVVGRTFARMIPFEPFSLLGGQGHPVGWHDSLSGTRVIRIR